MTGVEIAEALAELEKGDSLEFEAALRQILEVVHNHVVRKMASERGGDGRAQGEHYIASQVSGVVRPHEDPSP